MWTSELSQGTVLSPLLLNNNTITLNFNVYINDNTLLTLKSRTRLLCWYGTALIVIGDTWKEIFKNPNWY